MRKILLLFFAVAAVFSDSGFGYLRVLPSGTIIASDYRGTGLFAVSQTSLDSVGDPHFSRGRHTALWMERFILFKQIFPEGQVPAVYDLAYGRIQYLTDPTPSTGVPQPWGEKIVAPIDSDIVVFSGGTPVRRIPIGAPIQWIAVDSVHGCAAFIDDDGYIVLVNLTDGTRRKIMPAMGYLPAWNRDGTLLALVSSDGINAVDPAAEQFFSFANGRNFCWDPQGPGLFVQVTFDHDYIVDSSEIWYWVPGGERYKITRSAEIHEGAPAVSPDGRYLAFLALPEGDIYRAQIRRGSRITLSAPQLVRRGTECPIAEYRKPTPREKSDLWVPYLHQKWDVPDYFNGAASCGPSSGLMAIQRYDKLPPHPITCSNPYPHTHDFGWYVPNEYEYNGYVYDHPGLAPRVGDYYSDTTVYGAHGFCTSPTERVGTFGDSLVLLLRQHGLYSGWSSYSPAWSVYQGEIDDGYPMVALLYFGSSGHYNTWRGYFYNHTVISNDPYGDYNTSPWGQYNGEMAYYDWPGYDNGNYSPTVRYLFYARDDYTPPPADTLVDDLSSGMDLQGPGMYWRAWLGGFNRHAFWTASVASGDDVNSATWTPEISEGIYDIFVYIPDNYADATVRYQIHHAGEVDTVTIDQSAYSGEWVFLGQYHCVPGDYVYVGDVTGVSGQHIAVDAVKFSPLGSGIIVDDGDPGFNCDFANWHVGSYADSGWAGDYLWADATDTVENWARWTPTIPDTGAYDVYMWWMPAANRCDSVFVRVRGAFNDSFLVSQKEGATGWHYIGRFLFNAGNGGYVGISDRTAVGGDVIIADAVRWVFAGEVDTIIDDGDDGFIRHADPTFWHDGTGGYSGHFWWTYSTDAADTCFVEWFPILPHPAEYEVLAYIPGNHATAYARYRIFHANGEDTVVVNQASYYDEWVSLGTYYFTGAPDEKVYLGDATGHQGDYIAFDAVWWHAISLEIEDRQDTKPDRPQIVAYPNPFNSVCRIFVPSGTNAMRIYDIRGNLVKTLSPKGKNSTVLFWEPGALPSGVYIISAEVGGKNRSIRVLLVR
ncbi:T9SS type A sorting domain-containing protein [bacterium]|nr:T9SS type A sorting domain-containing protein [bacterium]